MPLILLPNRPYSADGPSIAVVNIINGLRRCVHLIGGMHINIATVILAMIAIINC